MAAHRSARRARPVAWLHEVACAGTTEPLDSCVRFAQHFAHNLGDRSCVAERHDLALPEQSPVPGSAVACARIGGAAQSIHFGRADFPERAIV